MEVEKKGKDTSSFWSFCYSNCYSSKPSREEHGLVSSGARKMEKKPGWKAMPYILGNETIERIATYGMAANFNVYLTEVFNQGQVAAANVISIWNGVSNCVPLLGAFLADASLGKFRTIALASFATVVGILTLTLTAWVPQFHPPTCLSPPEGCTSPTIIQIAILIMGLCWLAVGTGGIRPCSIPFAIDQFDTTSAEGRRGVSSFYNWYYTTQTVVQLINMTIVVYIQNKNWVLGFGILALLMSCAIILFFSGTKVYCYIPAEGSIFSGIAKVFVAAYNKRRLQIPANEGEGGVYYDPPLAKNKELKMPLTKQLKWLNKAALIQDNELNEDGLASDSWRLCSIEQVEEVKCLINIIPIWASGILCMIPMAQQGTFPVNQALKMDRHLGPKFEIPAASVSVVSLITIGIWLPCYDRFIQPALAKITKREEGITSLQKIVLGNITSILTMLSAGLVERRRRAMAISHGAPPERIASMSAILWLAPQFVMLGFSEMFNYIGHTEFYNRESPENMKSIGNSLLYLVMALSNSAGTLVMNLVHHVTGKQGRADWLNDDINVGRLDYYYFLIAGLASLNLVYLLFCAKRYRYKAIIKAEVSNIP